jgi:glycosyltransferase involved in cell wall biosynthesis
MKVAQLLYAGLGGHGSVAFSLLDADKKQEWMPVMGFLGIEPLLPVYAKICNESGIAYKYFPAISGKPWKTWRGVASWMKQSCPDAVILHSPTLLLPCLWYSKRYGVPLIIVEHQANALKRRTDWAVSCLGMLLADGVVLLTPDYKTEMKKRLSIFYREQNIRIIPNGINTELFVPHFRSSEHARGVRLGMAARFTHTKRQDVLVNMMEDLQRRMPEIDWQLSLAGDGENRENIVRLIEVKGMGESVELTGQLNERELITWYQSLNIYLLASDGETMNTSLIQAMATGLPIVASDVPGISNFVDREEQFGLLVQAQSPQGFADAVLELVENPLLCKRMEVAGRFLVKKSYSHDKMFADYRELLLSHV